MKDRNISGDYNEEGILLSFCPICGRMYKASLSNKQRKVFAVRISSRYNLEFSYVIDVVKKAPENQFFDYILKELNIVKEELIAVFENKK